MPQWKKKEREREREFYECLEETYHETEKWDYIMGDFNAKTGKEEYQKKAAGKCTIHNISNENGNSLGQFPTRNGSKIKSTTFLHKNIYLGT
jgi:endonuclease/exonuclease/phosphatase family metal-dependent hydrolase